MVGWGQGWLGVLGKHDNLMQMAAPHWGIPRNSLRCHMCMLARVCMLVCACLCVHMHMHMCGGTLLSPPTTIHLPTHPQGGPLESVKLH